MDEPVVGARPMIPARALMVAAGVVTAVTIACQGPRPPEDRPAPAGGAATEASRDGSTNGRLLFEETCGACHDRSGAGRPGQGPALRSSPLVEAAPDVLIRIVLDGLRAEESAGPAYILPMPSWRVIADRDLAAIATYVRSAFGGGGAAVSADLVARVRRATDGRRRPWSRAELEALAPPESR